MKGLTRRFFYYFIGFALGCVLVYVVFYTGPNKRDSWLPEGRVLEFLDRTEIAIPENLKCQLNCNNIPIQLFKNGFFSRGDVHFDKSATRMKPCPEYYITSSLKDGRKIGVSILTCEKEKSATLRSFECLKKDKDNPWCIINLVKKLCN